MATVVVLTTRRARGAGTRGDDGAPSAPSATRALVGALLGHEDDPGGSAATSTRDGWDDAGAPTWRDALTSARDALDALDFPRDTIVALSSTTDMPLDGRVALTHRVCAEHGARRALFVGDGDDAAWARDALTTGLDPNARFDGDGDGDGAVRVLANGDATRGNLLDAMRWLAAGARSGDSMLMHVASRVSPPPIGGEDIRATLLDALPRGAWAVLVLDVGNEWWGAEGCRGVPGVPYVAELGFGDDARRCVLAVDPTDAVGGREVTSAAARLAGGLHAFGGDDGGVVGPPMDAIARGGGGGGGGKRRGGQASSKAGDPACCAVQ